MKLKRRCQVCWDHDVLDGDDLCGDCRRSHDLQDGWEPSGDRSRVPPIPGSVTEAEMFARQGISAPRWRRG